jgi:hypothetical protein
VTMATLPLKAMFTFDSSVDEVSERRCASAIDTRGFRLRVGVALHADLRHGIIDARKIVWRECNCGRTDVLVQAAEFGRARNWSDPGLLREELGQRNLRRSSSFLDADRLQQVDDGRLALRASGVKRGKFVRLWLLPKAVQLRQAAQTLRGLTPYGFICKAGIQTHTDSKSPLQQNAGTKQPNPPF